MWKGFLIESKKYMSYESMSQKEKISFWLRYPFKWLGFQWLGVKDLASIQWRKLTRRALDGATALCPHGRRYDEICVPCDRVPDPSPRQ